VSNETANTSFASHRPTKRLGQPDNLLLKLRANRLQLLSPRFKLELFGAGTFLVCPQLLLRFCHLLPKLR
jgi:hypothetical protein